MQLIDTHCHIHSSNYPLDAEQVYRNMLEAGVAKLICVGEDVEDSKLAAAWALSHSNTWASVGVHPHEAKKGIMGIENLLKDKKFSSKIVAIGEIGLDYHYLHSSRVEQVAALEAQLQLAQEYNLPVIFHVREAYDDFWPVLAGFHGITGVLHSFTDSEVTLERALAQGLYIGVNGIATFTKDKSQTIMYKRVPLSHLLLETDSPYLTPAPWRGKVNEPAYVKVVAEYLSQLFQISLEDLAQHTSQNATTLFPI